MSIAALKNQVAQKKSKRRQLEERKKDVQKIMESLNKNFDDDVRDINKHISSCSSSLSSSIKGLGKLTLVTDGINADKEKDVTLDGNIMACYSNLSSEAARCAAEVSKLDVEIRNLNARIEAEKERERKERMKTLSDAFESFTNFI